MEVATTAAALVAVGVRVKAEVPGVGATVKERAADLQGVAALAEVVKDWAAEETAMAVAATELVEEAMVPVVEAMVPEAVAMVPEAVVMALVEAGMALAEVVLPAVSLADPAVRAASVG